jgi:two-component system, chemotaxis family, sensor kinase CheA
LVSYDRQPPQASLAPMRVTSVGLIQLLRTSPDALLVVSRTGVIAMVNELTEALFGYSQEELVGQQLEILLPDRFREAHSAHREHYFTAPTIRPMGTGLQLFGKRKEGSEFPVDIYLKPVLLDEELYAIGAVRDITEQKRMSRELERKNVELLQERNKLTQTNLALEEANRVRSQFFSTMSHELRTPLASIIGFSEMLLEDAVAACWDQQQQENLRRILKNSQHLLAMINDVLDMSKIEAGQIVLDFSQVDVRELLTSVIEEVQPLALVRHLILRTQVEEGIESFETNPTKFHQVLLNLVSNALKFTEQGEVTVSATRAFLPDQGVAGIAFAVQDIGIGIPLDKQERIFEAFYQVDGSDTRKVGGTGLGLYIVSKLVALLGGTISVQSTPGQGSTFTVLLPIKADHQHAAQGLPRLHAGRPQEVPTDLPSLPEPVPPFSEEVPGSALQPQAIDAHSDLILAIDDDPDVHVLIQAALQGTHYHVIGVQDPLTVMEQAQELHPCAITLDVMMPGLNGWQLLYQLKNNPATASIPVVVVSVLPEQATGYVLGADEYVIKPFKKEALRHMIKHVIEAKEEQTQEQV